MPENTIVQVAPRAFTRREKTVIRQDVKRFEKIGRDHRCVSLEDYANFVVDRMKTDDNGALTPKSFELFRGLVAYFGDQLLYETTLARLAGEVHIEGQGPLDALGGSIPGWLLADRFEDLHVLVEPLIYDRIFGHQQWPVPLDDLRDQIIDWSHGYLFTAEVETFWVFGEDMAPEEFLTA